MNILLVDAGCIPVLLGFLGLPQFNLIFHNRKEGTSTKPLPHASASGLCSNQDRAAPQAEERVPNIDVERDLTKHFLSMGDLHDPKMKVR
jgi:hypothetical protein